MTSTFTPKSYRRFGIITISAVYLLILVGGIVRSTGSGMGCPDWPKCFGQWVPPTEVSELPPNYKEIFQVQGKEIADFNAFKTWTEYINRLIGALIGLFIFITFLLSFTYWKADRLIVGLSLLSFLAVGFQGWLGSVVVATDLKPVLITLHMLMALLIVAMLIFTVARSHGKWLKAGLGKTRNLANKLLVVALVLSIAQIVMGTQVREGVDEVARSFDGQMREHWIDQLGSIFYVHRSFSILVLLVNVGIFVLVAKHTPPTGRLFRWALALMAVIGLEILSGVIMAYFAIPAPMQPVHLLLGTLLFGVQFVLLLMVNAEQVTKQDKSAKVAEVAV